MAKQTITVPPFEGSISVEINDELTIEAAEECQFYCSIGDYYLPDLSSTSLHMGLNGPYVAVDSGSGTYSTSRENAPTPLATAKSVQIG